MKLPCLSIVCLSLLGSVACESSATEAGAKMVDATQAMADSGAVEPDVSGTPRSQDIFTSVPQDGANVSDASTAVDTTLPQIDIGGTDEPDTQPILADSSGGTSDTGGGAPQVDTGAPQPVDAGVADYTIPAGLNGNPVPDKPELADFTAVKDTTNQFVTKDIFLGHWTVLWFYPFASTPG